jgi:hypothetical protein
MSDQKNNGAPPATENALGLSCPFCGDIRRPKAEETKLKFDCGSIFACVCLCCGAGGPVASTAGAALLLWDQRNTIDTQHVFLELAGRISP